MVLVSDTNFQIKCSICRTRFKHKSQICILLVANENGLQVISEGSHHQCMQLNPLHSLSSTQRQMLFSSPQKVENRRDTLQCQVANFGCRNTRRFGVWSKGRGEVWNREELQQSKMPQSLPSKAGILSRGTDLSCLETTVTARDLKDPPGGWQAYFSVLKHLCDLLQVRRKITWATRIHCYCLFLQSGHPDWFCPCKCCCFCSHLAFLSGKFGCDESMRLADKGSGCLST